MSNEKYIISTCTISSNTVIKNSKQFFHSNSINLNSFLLSVYQQLKTDYPKFYKMDNLSKLGFLASELLLKDENIKEYEPKKTGVVLANANASLDADVKYFQSIKTMASPALFVYTLPNIVAGEICIRNNFKGENSFFIAEEFDASFMYQYVNDLLDNNVIDLCICGWVDVLNENYKAVLFLVATKMQEPLLLFSEENMRNIFNQI